MPRDKNNPSELSKSLEGQGFLRENSDYFLPLMGVRRKAVPSGGKWVIVNAVHKEVFYLF